MSRFQKATKSKAKLRAALFGPSGSGKTFSALRIAHGIGKPVALIDTERGSASKYADRFDFATLDLQDRSIEGYVQALRDAAAEGFPVVVVDSLSHGWQDLLSEIDRLAAASFRGNTHAAWAKGTPKQRKLVDAILDYPGHLIATMRSKTEWLIEEGKNGKKTPVRVGLSPEQGKGIEYEFDLLMEITPEHHGNVIKDRSGRFQDRVIEKPGEDFGRELAAWLSEGADLPPRQAPAPDAKPPAEPLARHHVAIAEAWKGALARGATKADLVNVLGWYGVELVTEIGIEDHEKVIADLVAVADGAAARAESTTSPEAK